MINVWLNVSIGAEDISRIFKGLAAKTSMYLLEVEKKQREISEIGTKDEYMVE